MKISIDGKEIMEISDKSKIYLKYSLPGDDGIILWIIGAVIGKINERKSGFFIEWQQKLMADSNVDSIPANEDDFRNMVIARPDYKDRAARDEEQEK